MVDLLTIVSIIGYLKQYEKREVACVVSCRNLRVSLYNLLVTVKEDLIAANPYFRTKGQLFLL